MGAGIVQVSIDKGYDVVMKDTNETGLYRGVNQIQKGMDNAVKRKRYSRFARNVPFIAKRLRIPLRIFVTSTFSLFFSVLKKINTLLSLTLL